MKKRTPREYQRLLQQVREWRGLAQRTDKRVEQMRVERDAAIRSATASEQDANEMRAVLKRIARIATAMGAD